jgi:cytochrome c556
MSKTHLIAGLLIAGVIVAPVFAQTTTVSLTPQQVVAARQASFDMSSATFGAILKAAKEGADAKTESQPAAALASWAKVLPSLFPAGTGVGQTPMESKAKLDIWTDRAGFEKAAANYVTATATLSSLAEANNTAGFTAQLDEVKKACGGCHKPYRER